MRTLSAVGLLLVVVASMLGGSGVRAESFLEGQRAYGRYRDAEAARLAEVAETFRAAGALWPPRGLLLRGFKREGEVELWARSRSDERLVRVEVFSVCMPSGGLGPKVREGDLQVPEGLYQIDAFNPASRFHLALRVGYPNAVDRARARALGVSPGGDIMVHGGCVTIGCLPLRDGPMERLYVAAVRARASSSAAIPVHLHPCRYETASCQAALAAEGPTWAAHWAALEAIDAAFRRTATAPPGT